MELTEAVPVYECGVDGYVGEERRCESCNRFVSRRDEDGCASCYAPVGEVETVIDHDGTEIRLDDYVSNGKSLAERRQDERKSHEEESKKREKEKLKSVMSETTEVRWADVSVGQRIITTDWKGNLDTGREATVLSIMVAGDKCVAPLVPGSLTVLLEHYGPRVEVHSPDETVLVKKGVADTSFLPAKERFIVTAGDDMHGSGVKLLSVEFGLAATTKGSVYMGEINGKNSPYSGSRTIIAAFIDPREAKVFAYTARAAAARLRGSLLVQDMEEIAVDVQDTSFLTSHVPTRYTNFIVGMDESIGTHGVRVTNGTSERSTQSFSVVAPSVLDGIARSADMIADKLTELYDLKEDKA